MLGGIECVREKNFTRGGGGGLVVAAGWTASRSPPVKPIHSKTVDKNEKKSRLRPNPAGGSKNMSRV